MKARRKIRNSLLGFFLLLSLCGCSIENIQRMGTFATSKTEKEVTEEQEAFYYGYQTLSEEEQKVYRQLIVGLETFEKEITLSSITQDRLKVVAEMVMVDHPEYFWTEGGFQYYEEIWPGGAAACIKVQPDYLMESEEAQKIKKEIEATAKEWLLGLPSQADTYEKLSMYMKH